MHPYCCLHSIRSYLLKIILAFYVLQKVIFVMKLNENGTDGVGTLLFEEWIEKVFEINRVSDYMMIKLAIDNKIIVVLSCYAPQVG